jgi:m7GpppX diphosphatase
MYPATEMLIKKYSTVQIYYVREDMDIYNRVTKPYIEKLDLEENRWLYNILESKKQVEFRVFENENFILNKNWEMNENVIETFHCLAIPQDRLLKTIRDLNSSHLPLLNEILCESYKSIF